MAPSQLVTIAISVGVPLLAVAFTFGRLAERLDSFKEILQAHIDGMDETERRQDARLDDHEQRLRAGKL